MGKHGDEKQKGYIKIYHTLVAVFAHTVTFSVKLLFNECQLHFS